VGDTQPGASFDEQMQDYKIAVAHRAIQECNGNKTLAARSLQISRGYLHRIIKDLDSEDDPLSDRAPN